MENITYDNLSALAFSDLPTEALQDWFVVNIICNGFGSISAVCLLAAVFSGRRFHRSGAQLLIAHLIIIDLVICSIHSPISAVSTFLATVQENPNGAACPFIHFAFMATMYSGQWTSAFLAFNRLTATYFPHSYKRLFVGPVHIYMVLAAWVIGSLLNVSFFFGVGGEYGALPPWNGCGIRPDGSSSLYAWTVAMGLYSPLVLSFGCYLLIFLRAIVHHFRPSRVYMTSITAGRRRALKRKRLLIAKMLCLSSLMVCLFYLPNAVFTSSYSEVISRDPELQLWVRELFYLGYATNPLVFFAMSTDYRKSFRNLLFRIMAISAVYPDRQQIFSTTQEVGFTDPTAPQKNPVPPSGPICLVWSSVKRTVPEDAVILGALTRKSESPEKPEALDEVKP